MKNFQITRHTAPVVYKILGAAVVLGINVMTLLRRPYGISDTDWMQLGLAILFALCILSYKAFVLIRYDRNEIRQGYLMLGLRFPTGTWDFNGVETIFINNVGIRWDTEPHPIHGRSSTPKHYNAYLKITDGEKFLIAQSRSRKKIFATVHSLNGTLKTNIQDNTNGK